METVTEFDLISRKLTPLLIIYKMLLHLFLMGTPEHEKRILGTINAPYSENEKKQFDKINKSKVLSIAKKQENSWL